MVCLCLPTISTTNVLNNEVGGWGEDRVGIICNFLYWSMVCLCPATL